MARKKQNKLRKAVSSLATGIVLAVLIVPVFITGWWLYSSTHKQDTRKVVHAATFQVRKADEVAAPLKPLTQPLVSITFDDGWESAYTNAFPVLQREGFHTTQYVITGEFDNKVYISVDQLRAMVAAGTEVGSHTIDHPDLTTLNAAELKHQLKDSQVTLEQLFGGHVRDFTSPYGAYNAYTLKAIGTYYRSQKNAEGDDNPAADPLNTINTAVNFNSLNFNSFSIRNDTKLSDIQRLVNETVKRNGWLVLTYHQVDNSNEQYSVTPEVFKQQMDLVSRSGIRGATVGQVMDALHAAPKAGQ